MFEIIDAHTLKIGNQLIKFPRSIGGYQDGAPRVVEFHDLIVVNFMKYGRDDIGEGFDDVDMSRNIWAFDQRGNKVWEVESLETKLPQLNTSYSYVSVKDEKLIGSNVVGYYVEIDPIDGSIEFYPKDQGRPW